MRRILLALAIVVGALQSSAFAQGQLFPITVSASGGCSANCTFTGTTTLGGQLTWQTGLGAINSILGPTDSNLYVGSNTGRNLILGTSGAQRLFLIDGSGLQWNSGLGAITHLLGPSDQILLITSAASRAARLMANNGSAGFEVSSTGNSIRHTSASVTDTIGHLSVVGYQLNGVMLNTSTAPTISSACGTTGSPSVSASNGNAAFEITLGTNGTDTTCVLTMPAAAHGWRIDCADITTKSGTVFVTKETASTTTSVTVGNFNTSGTAAAWAASDHLVCGATAY